MAAIDIGKIAVSIPDGDSFLREVDCSRWSVWHKYVSIPDGDSFLREVDNASKLNEVVEVSIPDGDSFLREDL